MTYGFYPAAYNQSRPNYSRPATTSSTPRPASPAAINFMESLLAGRDFNSLPAPLVSILTERNASPATFTAARCSWAIDTLKAIPRAPRPDAAPAVEAGFYLMDGEVYKVQDGKQDPTRRYAKILVLGGAGEKGRFVYQSGAIRNLRPEHKLTLEDAKLLGHQHGICCICGATLTDAASVANGIGPICATRI